MDPFYHLLQIHKSKPQFCKIVRIFICFFLFNDQKVKDDNRIGGISFQRFFKKKIIKTKKQNWRKI
jgi:hypothetical protein